MPQIHFIEGPVGAGKSSYATRLASQGAFTHIALDEWFARLYSPDRPQENFVPWYMERKDRLLALIVGHARAILATGNDVALELGMIQRAPRLALLQQLSHEGIDFTVHVIDAPVHVRRERVRRRNTERGPTFSMHVPDHIFDIASAMWEPPDEQEREEFSIIFPESSARV